MEYEQNENQFTIDYTAHHQFYVGVWFAGIGFLSLLALPILSTNNSKILGVIGGLLVGIIGVLLCVLTSRIETKVSKAQHSVDIRLSSRIKSRQKDAHLSIEDISKVEVATFQYEGRSRRKTRVLYLRLIDGGSLKIAGQQDYAIPFNKKPVSDQYMIECAERLADFLGVPFDNDPDKWHPFDS